MVTAGIKELKNQLSRYIGLVKRGDDVLITERGRVIARIVKEDSSSSSLRQALQPLILKGQVLMPTRDIKRDVPRPIELPGKAGLPWHSIIPTSFEMYRSAKTSD